MDDFEQKVYNLTGTWPRVSRAWREEQTTSGDTDQLVAAFVEEHRWLADNWARQNAKRKSKPN